MQPTYKPLISVVIATNSSDFLDDCLQSVFEQTYQNYEVVLILNGPKSLFSNGNLNALAASKLSVHQTDIPGLAHCLNLGLVHAQGELIARLDSDDFWDPSHLENLVTYMLSNDLDIVSSSANFVDENGRFLCSKRSELSDKSIRHKLRYSNPLLHPGTLYKKELIVTHGGYRGFRYAQDWELWLRLASDSDIKFGKSSKNSLNYRLNPAQSRGKIESYLDGFMYLLRHAKPNFHSVVGILVRLFYILYRVIK